MEVILHKSTHQSPRVNPYPTLTNDLRQPTRIELVLSKPLNIEIPLRNHKIKWFFHNTNRTKPLLKRINHQLILILRSKAEKGYSSLFKGKSISCINKRN